MMAIGFDLEKYLFLLGVVILWYLVGRALDAQLRPNLLIETRFVKLGRTLWDFALILSGLAFFIGGLSDRNGLAQDWSDKKTHVVISLCFIWAAVLILFPLRGLILRFHRMRSPLCSEDVRNQ
jgi:small-conductance mechanosensitive channel